MKRFFVSAAVLAIAAPALAGNLVVSNLTVGGVASGNFSGATGIPLSGLNASGFTPGQFVAYDGSTLVPTNPPAGGGAFSTQFSVLNGKTNITDLTGAVGTNMAFFGDPGPWTPVALSNANLRFRYRGDDLNGVVANGAAVTNFPMYFGGFATNAGAAGFTLSSNAVNGHSMMFLDGSSTAWLRTSNTILDSTLDRSFTMFAVLRVTNNDTATLVRTFISSGATTFYGGIAGLSAVWRVQALTPTGTINTGYIMDGGANPVSTILVYFRYNGTNVCTGNGLDWESRSEGNPFSLNAQAYIGNFANGTLNPFGGGIVDVLGYKAALSDAESAGVAQQLMRDYGMSTNYARLIFCDVDSITYGFGLQPGEVWPARLAQRFGLGARVWDSGVNSDSVANILSSEEVNYYHPPGQRADYIKLGTTTDLAVDGKTAEQCFAQDLLLFSRMGAKNFVTWNTDTLPRQNFGSTTFFETNRVNLNRYWSNSWPLFLTGGYISITDSGLLNSTSTAYQSDDTHPAASGQMVLAGLIFKALTSTRSGPNGGVPYLPYGLQTGTNYSAFKTLGEDGSVLMRSSLSNSATPTVVTVSGSPFLWTNPLPVNVSVSLSGGEIQGIGLNGGVRFMGITNGCFPIGLQQNQWISITNTVAPFATWNPL